MHICTQTYLDTVNWVYVLHAVKHNPPHFFQSLVRTHHTDGASLHQDIALRQELDGLQNSTLELMQRE